MFGISDLLFRHFDKRLDRLFKTMLDMRTHQDARFNTLHAHITHLKQRLIMSAQDQVQHLNTLNEAVAQLGQRIAPLVSDNARLASENESLRAQLADAQSGTGQVDDAIAQLESTLSGVEASLPAEAPAADGQADAVSSEEQPAA